MSHIDIRAGKRWYVVETTTRDLGTTERQTRAIGSREIGLAPHGLRQIAARIRDLGFEAQVAVDWVRARGADRKRIWSPVPAFGEYMFVRFDYHDDPWMGLLRVPGVLHIMPRGREKPMPVPPAVMAAMFTKMEELEAATLDAVVKRAGASFSRGQAVQIPEGSKLFFRASGTVEQATAERVRVLLSSLGGEEIVPRVVEVAAGDVEAA